MSSSKVPPDLDLGLMPLSKSHVHQRSFCERLTKLRFQLCLFLFASMLFTMFNNLNLGLTLLCMVQGTKLDPKTISNETEPPLICQACLKNKHFAQNQSDPIYRNSYSNPLADYAMHKLNWTLENQWIIMSSISWGRLVSPFCGFLVDRVDNSMLMEVSFLLAGLANALFPLVSSFSFPLVVGLRTMVGMTDAIIQPCLNRFIAQWYTEKTRTNAFGWSTAGRQLGALIVFPVSGFLCTQTQLLGGWPMVFYVSALGCCGWTFFFFMFKICRLQKREKFLKLSTRLTISSKLRPKIPWLKIARSPVAWANLMAMLCHEVPVNVLFGFLPRYMRDVMKVSIQHNAMLSMLPVACFLAAKIGASQLDHFVKGRFRADQVPMTRLCKIFNSVASLGLGVFLTGASFLGAKDNTLALVCLCCGAASAGLHTPGCLETMVTMAPTFTGSLSGFAYFFISVTSIVNPLFIGYVVVDETPAEWSKVFKCTAALALLPLVFFNLWGSADEQPWTIDRQDVGAKIRQKTSADLAATPRALVTVTRPDSTTVVVNDDPPPSALLVHPHTVGRGSTTVILDVPAALMRSAGSAGLPAKEPEGASVAPSYSATSCGQNYKTSEIASDSSVLVIVKL